MLALGEDAAAEIFRQMEPGEVRKVGSAMSRLGRIDQQTVDIVMAEFKQILMSEKVSGVKGSPEFLKKALGKAFSGSGKGLELADSIAKQNYKMRALDGVDAATLYRISKESIRRP